MKNKKTQIVFWGTSKFSVFVLEEMERCGFLPEAIVTTPDKPRGRNLIINPPPVKIWAEKRNITLYQPISLKDFTLPGKYEVFVLAAYGKIIPKNILNIPMHGFINVHPSLLPKWRGASPIQSSILAGEKENGVSVILLDEEMDHGPIIKKERNIIANETQTYVELEERLARIGGKMVCEIIPEWINGQIKTIPQAESDATYCKKIDKKDGFIPPEIILGKEKDQEKIILAERKVRALNPDPGTFTILNINKTEKRIKILSAKIIENIFVPEKIIPEGKKEMKWEDFLRGHKI